MQRIMGWMATAATLTFAIPAAASQDDPRLYTLFSQLKSVETVAQAQRIEQSIWHIWLRANDEAVSRRMEAGLRAMAIRDHAAALAVFDDIVKITPDFAEGWNKRATVHYLLGNFEQSIADISRTLALEPRHFGALSGLGLVNLALGRESQALDAFEAALKVYPLMPGAKTHIKALREKLRGRDT